MNSIHPEQLTNDLVAFLKTAFAKAGFTNAVIGLSGGVDSAASAALAVRALGTDHVYPVLMPYGPLSAYATINATEVVGALGVNSFHVTRIDIKPILESLMAKDPGMDNIRRGNLMARARMMILYDQAKKRQALVVGTENKTEYLLGYFTRFGDEASDIEPLRSLYKTQVYELAQYLKLPDVVLSGAPTAGLWEGQTDEGEFGFTYRDADHILYQYADEKKTEEKIVGDKTVIQKVLARAKANDFKHRLPILP
ncbi:NAD(+) synthase [Candidatus Gottesmanbacteria bacterium RIFOXYB1_FULL_47_11]|uniref:NH(3)-dependent NAD(+) synthetase n=1 Tax=Candidatus Gottesmanbacteria bacterium RIFOXYB1_FULL_47_11 TaxID=1798401 RepID=A0A1F6BDJ8_9BACT|nr:MAG: NAD(+) synthase [Candidatus Gottesmanbacteria bacterium RIFOXYB1_FULL_47_11]